MNISESHVPAAAARALIEEILGKPELNFEKKSHRMRPILEHLFEIYLADPNARSSERKLAEKFYAEGDSGRDSAKKVVSRLRRHLDNYCESKLPLSRSVRVTIPSADYRLVFYEKLKRYDADPVNWIWRAYLDQSLPVRVAFLHPGAQWHHKGFSPNATVRLYRSLLKITGGRTPEPMSLRHEGASSQLSEPQHKVIFATAPLMDTISTQYLYARRGLEVLAWERLQYGGDGPREGRQAIIDPRPPTRNHVRSYEDNGQTAHVLVTRFTFPKPPFPQLTVISSYEPQAIEKAMEALADLRFVFQTVTTDVLGEDEWEKAQAPAIFQIVLAVARQPELNRNVLRDVWGEPTVRLARVFAKHAFVPEG